MAHYSTDFSKAFRNQVINRILESMPESYSLPSEWGKKPECWDKVKRVQLNLYPLRDYCIDISTYQNTIALSKKDQTVVLGINVQTEVIKKGDKYWIRLYKWCSDYMKLPQKQDSILLYATNFRKTIPSEAQSKVILEIEKRAKAQGFV